MIHRKLPLPLLTPRLIHDFHPIYKALHECKKKNRDQPQPRLPFKEAFRTFKLTDLIFMRHYLRALRFMAVTY